MKSLFEQLVDEIDAAIVDVTLSKIPKGEKAKKLQICAVPTPETGR